ncbi:molybdenum cofactor biosynthesis protein MoaE [Tritonibacter scottomollicae]|uniref:Molybdopterin synthase catalytic subunit n=1 Tax=Tritonibacter scottomollicae TaxID=483013 RepID=A0A2T1AMX2_TRISK|nr:molybdenum cofactor biosynthesis protein MoaE [Tritonibacter scottomollicae]PRZ49949.1 molybdopterin synthase subunit MoaE [Tritonibacter scottomollicae]
MRVAVQEAPFDFGAEAEAFARGAEGAGAVVTFTGVVREADSGAMACMEIEHYPGMTQKALEQIATEAMSRWDLTDALVIHRYGRLAPGAQIMMVATAARHRVAAFDAAEYLMDYLKSRAPFWKKEILQDGSADWVAAKDADEDALRRW